MKTIILICCLLFSLTGYAKPIKKIKLPRSPLWKKLNSIVIQKLDVEEAEPRAVFRLLQIRSKALDPEKKGVHFVLKGLKNHPQTITIQLEKVPLADVIKYVCMTAGLAYKVEDFAVIIMPKPPAKKKKQQD